MQQDASHIIAIVCANGLGHFRRTIGVLHAWQQLVPGLHIDVVCTEQQLTLNRDWDRLVVLQAAGVGFHTGYLEGSVVWQPRADAYTPSQTGQWLDRLGSFPGLYDADMVLSDNLEHVLALRADAVMLGSFLWPDILDHAYPAHPAVAAIVASGRALLRRHRPPMLCVADLAMPDLDTYTRIVPLGWMGQWPRPAQQPALTSTRRIALLTGASPVSDALTQACLTQLLALDCEIALPPRVIDAMPDLPKDRVVAFAFTQEAFEACRWIVCRPGVGTLTDAVAAGVPVICYYESHNLEMRFNAKRVAGLGMGIDACSDATPDTAQLATWIYDDALQAACRRHIAARPTDGLLQAAHWLQAYMTKQRSTSSIPPAAAAVVAPAPNQE
ncbi:MAG: hypothetical protein OHK0039_21030 [Bacteroidia bacterium]